MTRRALAVLLLALAACRPQATALRVEVDADPALSRYVQMVRVRVYSPPTAAQPVEQHDVVVGVGAVRWPLAFNITTDDADQRVRVDVDGFREPSQDPDAAGLIRARAITSFRDGKVLLLPLVFWSACRNTGALDCGLTETCSREGTCVSADMPAATLEEFMPAGRDAGPACEAGARALADVCVVESPADAAPDATPDAIEEPPAPPDAPTADLPVAVDAAPDLPVDARIDATTDAPPDAAPDLPAAPDATPDATPDARMDATPDATPDAAPDAMRDATPDATPDVAPDLMTPTPIVELLSPALGAILSGPSPTLRWVQPAGAMEAHLQVCAAPDCNRVEYGFTDRMGSNTHRVGTTLTQGRHWWRVSATSASGPWSMMRSFEVRGRGLAAGALGTTPDFTSDGVHDLVTGLPGFFGGGQVWLYPGRPTGLDPTTPFLVTRSTTGAFYGERMAAVGDMNGDGTLDLAVYAPPSGVDGSIHILGGSSTGLAGTPAYRLEPPSGAGPTSFGESFAGVGDLNGDGLADVIAGSPAFGAGAGRVWLFLGVRAGGAPVATPLDSPGGTGGRFGNVVAGLGDFNGDGLGDFAVHAPDRLGGTTYVYLGAADGRPRLAHSFESPSGMSAGTRLAGGFDFDGDGLGDLAVSSPTAMADGLVYLYYGASGTRESFPDDVLSPPLTSESFFGVAVAPAGDIDGDGLDDLIVAQGGRDHVHVFAGAARSFSHRLLATVQRPSDGAAFFTTGYGKALAALDLNGDGRRDLVIGAYNDAGGGGRVYVHTQVPTGGVPAAPTLVLTGAAGARLGGSFAQ